jgi:hypothetical protein
VVSLYPSIEARLIVSFSPILKHVSGSSFIVPSCLPFKCHWSSSEYTNLDNNIPKCHCYYCCSTSFVSEAYLIARRSLLSHPRRSFLSFSSVFCSIFLVSPLKFGMPAKTVWSLSCITVGIGIHGTGSMLAYATSRSQPWILNAEHSIT